MVLITLIDFLQKKLNLYHSVLQTIYRNTQYTQYIQYTQYTHTHTITCQLTTSAALKSGTSLHAERSG